MFDYVYLSITIVYKVCNGNTVTYAKTYHIVYNTSPKSKQSCGLQVKKYGLRDPRLERNKRIKQPYATTKPLLNRTGHMIPQQDDSRVQPTGPSVLQVPFSKKSDDFESLSRVLTSSSTIFAQTYVNR